MVSPSATRVSITVKDPTASPSGPLNTYHNFFRVVANDGVQGPADGAYLQKQYGTGKILVISDTSTYGVGLASQVASGGERPAADHSRTVARSWLSRTRTPAPQVVPVRVTQ